ncbi:MAG: hypothetical protein HY867_09185 [Chloroflexi bacterium]|nr:hypothetical protein [Chloroflexota bacterium]
MLKKTVLTSLALLLVLGLAFQTIPVRALKEDLPISATPVILHKAILLRGFPPNFLVTGIMPAGCYKLRVNPPEVGRQNPNTSITPITIRVFGIQSNTCTSRPHLFITIVTVDPIKLNLSAGRYVARFVSIQRKGRLPVFFTIPHGLD